MTFIGPAHWREWTCVMRGDVVVGAGAKWRVERVVHESGMLPNDGPTVCWVELNGGTAGRRTMRVPDARFLVEMHEGPGWGEQGAGDAALRWVIGAIAEWNRTS